MSCDVVRWTPERGWHTLSGEEAEAAQADAINKLRPRCRTCGAYKQRNPETGRWYCSVDHYALHRRWHR